MVERADEVQERALARAGRAGQRDELTGVDVERDVLERAHASVLERLADVLEDDLGAAHFGVTVYFTTRFCVPTVTVARSTSGIPRDDGGQIA